MIPGFSPDMIGNPWVKHWKPKSSTNYRISSSTYSTHATTYDLTLPLNVSLLAKHGEKYYNVLSLNDQFYPHRVMKKISYVKCVNLESNPRNWNRLRNARHMNYESKQATKKQIALWMNRYVKANPCLEGIHIMYDRSDISEKFPLKTLRKLRTMKEFSLKGTGEYLNDISEKIFNVKRQNQLETLSLAIKNFHYKYSFNKPDKLTMFFSNLPFMQNLKELNLDCYDQNSLSLTTLFFQGLYKLVESHPNLKFDVRTFIQGSLPSDGANFFSKLDCLSLCTNHLLSDRKHIDSDERMRYQKKYGKKLMINFCSGYDVKNLDWIEGCTNLKILDLHFSANLGEDSLTASLEHIKSPSLHTLIVDFERAPGGLDKLIHRIKKFIGANKGIEAFSLYLKNILQLDEVYSAFEDLKDYLHNIKAFNLLLFDEHANEIDFPRLCNIFKSLPNIVKLKLELAILRCSIPLNLISETICSLPLLNNLELKFEGEPSLTTTGEFLVASLKDLHRLAIYQQFEDIDWLSKKVLPNLKNHEKLESFEFTQEFSTKMVPVIKRIYEGLKNSSNLKNMTLTFPIEKGMENLTPTLFRNIQTQSSSFLQNHQSLKNLSVQVGKKNHEKIVFAQTLAENEIAE